MQIIPFTFLIFDYILVCGALSGATLLLYVVLYAQVKIITHLLAYLLVMVQIVIKI